MKIFVSWSGERSKPVASALKRWLPDVIQTLDVWMSAHDIDAGAKWNGELDAILQSSNFGILCLTAENQSAPWILFEAGALSKTPKIARVIPYLVGLNPTDVQFPLAQFQGVQADKDGTYRLLQSINEAGSLGISPEKLERAFARWWPDLDKELGKVPTPDKKTAHRRTDRDLLEEILGLLRSGARRAAKGAQHLFSSADLDYTAEDADYATGGLFIDSRPFFGKTGKEFMMIYKPQQTVSDFLDEMWGVLNKHGRVPAFTYGDLWLLEEPKSGHRFDDIGIEYCRSGGATRDHRPIESMGILEGAKLVVVRLKGGE